MPGPGSDQTPVGESQCAPPVRPESGVERGVRMQLPLTVFLLFKILDGCLGGNLLLVKFYGDQKAANGIESGRGILSEVLGVTGFMKAAFGFRADFFFAVLAI